MAGALVDGVDSAHERAVYGGFPMTKPHVQNPVAEIGDAPDPAPSLSTAFDRVLGEINREYADKRASGRLAVPRLSRVAYDDVAAAALDPRADGREGTAQRAWDSQFKLLPLLRQTWEELALSK